MKNKKIAYKKGFTLTELLSVIVVLGLLSILVVPSINNIIKNSRKDLYQSQLNLIKSAAKMWANEEENKILLENVNTWPYELTLGDLQTSGFLEENIENPLKDSNETFHENMIIQINKIDDFYEYVVIDRIDPLAPVITLNGSNTQNIEIMGTYQEKGAKAVSSDGKTLDINISIKKNGSSVGNIDTTNLDTYKVIYSATDGKRTSSLVRTVKIVDTTKPILTCNDCPENNTVIMKIHESYELPTVTATDNSGEEITVYKTGSFSTLIPGERTLIYTGTDSSGNKATLSLKFIVDFANLKEVIESDTEHIVMNTKVNGQMVNKVIGSKSTKYDQKNYVWYSGQLWQVLETNDSNNSIKLVTADPLTAISYGETNDWNTSWVRKWLNEEFLSILKNQDVIVDTIFCLDEPVITESTQELYSGYWLKKVSGATPINICQNSVLEKVGLMTVEDYAYALNGTTLNYQGNNFLDYDSLIWLMNPYTGDTRTESNRNKHMWVTWYNNPSYLTVGIGLNNDGVSANSYDYSITNNYGLGVRAVISIKDDALIKSGTGIKSDPFVLTTERVLNEESLLVYAKVGEYVYIDESNNPYTFTDELVLNGVSYNTTKDKVRYRIVKINDDGTVKLERADVLKNLPNTIANRVSSPVPYYYKIGATAAESCFNDSVGSYFDKVVGKWYLNGCSNHNIFQPTSGSGEYAYAESENVAYFLNNATNSFYNWYSNETKKMIIESEWKLPVSASGKDYKISLYNNDEVGTYPSTTNDGVITAYVGLPQFGEIYSGNDEEYSYWYINRWQNSSNLVTYMYDAGTASTSAASHDWIALRPVIVIKPNIKIKEGEGTISNPYSIGI